MFKSTNMIQDQRLRDFVNFCIRRGTTQSIASKIERAINWSGVKDWDEFLIYDKVKLKLSPTFGPTAFHQFKMLFNDYLAAQGMSISIQVDRHYMKMFHEAAKRIKLGESVNVPIESINAINAAYEVSSARFL